MLPNQLHVLLITSYCQYSEAGFKPSHPPSPTPPSPRIAERLPIIKRLCYRILCFMQLGFEGTPVCVYRLKWM